MSVARFLAATALSSFALLLTSPSAAQTSSPTGTTPTDTTERPVTGVPQDIDAREAPGQIVVTGSRIKRAGFDTLEPATVISDEYLATRGLTNVADALNELPGFGVGVTPEGNQAGFGVGQNFVNRFGLALQLRFV